MKKILYRHLKTVLATLWFAFTFSLVTWWWIFTLFQFQSPTTHRMFAWEGSILLGFILIGGIALILFSYRDQKRHQRLCFFFSTFSHDIKTSITRLRLQADVWDEKNQGNHPAGMKRFIQDIQHLDLQLENALWLANVKDSAFLHEEVSLNHLLGRLRNEFPDLSFHLEQEAYIIGEGRALLSVFRNLLQNAVLHGKATTVRFYIRTISSDRLAIYVEDDGLGFKGHLSKLGSEILLSTNSHHNGIGLLITKYLLKKMKGNICFASQENAGFTALLHLEGHV